MRRRDFIAGLGGVVAWPLAASAQQPRMPVIGFLSPGSPGASEPGVAVFRQGLSEAGYVEGRNVTIDYRFAGTAAEVPELAADLVRRRVAVIVAVGTRAALAAKADTATIPIVFAIGTDPVQFGLVASLSRPGGNLTGVTFLTGELGPKRLELLHEAVPAATLIGLLLNQPIPQSEAFQAAARTLGLRLHLLYASTERDIDAAFATLVQVRAGGLVIGGDPFLANRSEQVIALALRHAVPTINQFRGTVSVWRNR